MKKIFLFKVDDIFQTSFGLIITPGIPLDHYEESRDINLLLKKPDGIKIIEGAEIFYSFPIPTPDKKMLTVLFKQLKKEDVPIGTEIWFVNDTKASQVKHVDAMSILIEKNLDKNDYIEYVFICNTWTKDPRHRARNMIVGETKGLFRLSKTTLQVESLVAMEGDGNNVRFYKAVSKIINEYKRTNTFPEKAHFASG